MKFRADRLSCCIRFCMANPLNVLNRLIRFLPQLARFSPFAIRESNNAGAPTRITSYNVCYTKLLRLVAAFVAESIAVDALGIQAGFLGGLVESGGIVPAGAAGLLLAARLLEEDTDGRSIGAEGGGDAGGKTVTGGCANHQHLVRAGAVAESPIPGPSSGAATR